MVIKKKRTKKTSKNRGSSLKNNLCTRGKNDSGSAGYFVGAIGAAVYYISTATTFWGGVLGLLKAVVWPAFLVFELLKFLAA